LNNLEESFGTNKPTVAAINVPNNSFKEKDKHLNEIKTKSSEKKLRLYSDDLIDHGSRSSSSSKRKQ